MLLAVVASAQDTSSKIKFSGFVESQTNFQNGRGETSTGVNVLVNVTITKRFGLYSFGQTSKNYSQIYAGPTFSPKPWIQFGAGIGAEQAKHPLRGGAFVWMGKKKVSNLFITEHGASKGSGWYKNILNVQVTKRLGVGAIAQRFLGVGPYMQFKLSKRFMVWGGPTYDIPSHKAKATVALHYSF
jgi:hypothetical protein